MLKKKKNMRQHTRAKVRSFRSAHRPTKKHQTVCLSQKEKDDSVDNEHASSRDSTVRHMHTPLEKRLPTSATWLWDASEDPKDA